MEYDLFTQSEPYNPVVTDTKRASYNQLKDSLPAKRQAVYDTLKSLGKATAKEIAKTQDVPINEVTGRLNELVKAGLVSEKELTHDPELGLIPTRRTKYDPMTGRHVTLYMVELDVQADA